MARKATKKTTGKKAASRTTKTRTKRATPKATKRPKAKRPSTGKRGAPTRKTATKARKSTAARSAKAPTPKTAVKKVAKKRKPERAAPAAATSLAEVEVAAKPRFLPRKECEEFRLALLEKRAELVGDVGTLQDEALRGSRSEAAGDLSSMPVHMADLGTDNYEMEFTLGLLEGGRAVLNEIEEALERIRNGTYGACLATGRPIGKARLRAQPWAKYCYEYTLALEEGKRLEA